MLTSQAQVTTNLKCPITAKLINDIDEPVQDQKARSCPLHAHKHFLRHIFAQLEAQLRLILVFY